MDIAEIRRENMLVLIDGFKTQAKFADAISTPASYISQLKKGVKTSGARVTMGNDIARQIETALNLPYGWMDVQHNSSPAQMNNNTYNNHGNQVNNSHISGSLNQSLACCDKGVADLVELQFYPTANFNEQKQTLFLSKQILSVPATFATVAIDNLMQPVIRQKSLVAVSKLQEGDLIYPNKIYVLNMGGLLICRYLERLTGSRMRVYSEYDKTGVTLTQDEFTQEYQIMGSVVWLSSFME